jgi:hypothetical protein
MASKKRIRTDESDWVEITNIITRVLFKSIKEDILNNTQKRVTAKKLILWVFLCIVIYTPIK